MEPSNCQSLTDSFHIPCRAFLPCNPFGQSFFLGRGEGAGNCVVSQCEIHGVTTHVGEEHNVRLPLNGPKLVLPVRCDGVSSLGQRHVNRFLFLTLKIT